MTGPMREVLSRYRRRLDSAVPVPTRPRPKAVCRSAKVFTGWLRTSRTKTDSSTRNVPNVSQRLKPRVNSVSCRSRCARRAGRHAGQRPFDCPPAWDHREPLLACGFAHDLDRAAQDLVGPLQQAAGEPTVGEEEPHPGTQGGIQQDRFRTVAVLGGGGQHDHNQEQAEGVGDDEPLPAVDLLAGVVPTTVPADGVGALHTLRIDQPGAGLRIATLLYPQLAPPLTGRAGHRVVRHARRTSPFAPAGALAATIGPRVASAWRPLEATSITNKIPSPSTKEGRDGNRAPFAILRDALATGLAEDCELWLTWEKVSHNRRQLTWSRTLREWAGLHVEHTDEEIAQQDMHGDDQLIIPSECWPAVRTELAELLDTAESGGAAAARRWLESRGLHWIAVARTQQRHAVSAKRKSVGHLSRLGYADCALDRGVIGSGIKRSNPARRRCRR